MGKTPQEGQGPPRTVEPMMNEFSTLLRTMIQSSTLMQFCLTTTQLVSLCRFYLITSQLDQFCQNLKNTWSFTSFKLFEQQHQPKRHLAQILVAQLYVLHHLINAMCIQSVTEATLLSIKNTVEIYRKFTQLILYHVSSGLVTFLN